MRVGNRQRQMLVGWREMAREIHRDTPLAWWPLDEPAGSALFDDRMGAIDATPSGPTLGAGGSIVPASGLWTAQTNRGAFTRQSGAGGVGQAWSAGALIKCTSSDAAAAYAGNPALTVLGDHSGSIWQGFGVHGGKVRFALFNNAGGVWEYADGATAVNDDRWRYIGFSCTGAAGANNTIIYVDGRPDALATISISIHTSASMGFDTIGAGYNAGNYGDGFLGQIAHPWIKKAVVAPERFRAHWEALTRPALQAA